VKAKFAALAPEHAAGLSRVMTAMDPWRRLGFSADSLGRFLLKPDAALERTAILDDGRLIGALAVRSPWLRGPYLELLAVFPEAQGRSIGRQAVTWACTRAKADGAANFWACVSAFNTQARGFYAHLGFAETTALTDLIQPGEDEILLRKNL